ncbi:hypothetical protein U1Q18_015185 [Sarracenia purpurea var. burkii]
MKVRIDISKPLRRGIKIALSTSKLMWISFAYERLPDFYFWCGYLRHIYRLCNEWIDTECSRAIEKFQYNTWLCAIKDETTHYKASKAAKGVEKPNEDFSSSTSSTTKLEWYGRNQKSQSKTNQMGKQRKVQEFQRIAWRYKTQRKVQLQKKSLRFPEPYKEWRRQIGSRKGISQLANIKGTESGKWKNFKTEHHQFGYEPIHTSKGEIYKGMVVDREYQHKSIYVHVNKEQIVGNAENDQTVDGNVRLELNGHTKRESTTLFFSSFDFEKKGFSENRTAKSEMLSRVKHGDGNCKERSSEMGITGLTELKQFPQCDSFFSFGNKRIAKNDSAKWEDFSRRNFREGRDNILYSMQINEEKAPLLNLISKIQGMDTEVSSSISQDYNIGLESN